MARGAKQTTRAVGTAMKRNEPDSAIWTNPASDLDPFAHLVVPDNLDELAAEAARVSDRNLARRRAKFRTRPSWQLLLKTIY